MGSCAVKSPLLLFVLPSLGLAASALPPQDVFEQIAPSAWRTRAAGSELVVLPNGFIVRRGKTVERFRWDRSMQLRGLIGEKPHGSHTYSLSGCANLSCLLPNAERVRAVSKDRKLSVLYYFGARGLEFDIEAVPGARLPQLRLESLDAELSGDGDTGILAAGEPFSLKPVAYTLAEGGARHVVSASYRLEGTRRLVFRLGSYSRRERLAVDPVMTYATYFGGTGDDTPIAIRELPDGSVLIAGNTTSTDLPDGFSVNGILMQPSGVGTHSQCFVARLLPSAKQIIFDSYFGGPGYTTCSAMDLDASGRILLAGASQGSATLTTPDAQYPVATQLYEGFLARISADGKTLEHSTFLSIETYYSEAPIFMRAGPAETAYIAAACSAPLIDCWRGIPDLPGGYQQAAASVLLLRYNIASKQLDQKTYLGDTTSGFLQGMEVSPSGAVNLFGSYRSATLPLQNPIQTDMPKNGAGFITQFSPDFRTLLFSSYLGGENSPFPSITSLIPNADGSLWLSGTGSLPSLTGGSAFAVLVKPGSLGLLKEFAAGDPSDPNTATGSVLLSNGRFCIYNMLGDPFQTLGGTPLFGGVPSPGQVPMFGCLNDNRDDIHMLTPVSNSFIDQALVAPSQAGGIWSLQVVGHGGVGDVIPYDLKVGAIQPFRPLGDTYDLVLRYIDLTTPNPVLINPQPLELFALQGDFTSFADLAGSNFALGMTLEINGQSFPLTVSSPTTANLSYESPSLPLPGAVLNLTAGSYSGRFIIPLQPQPVASDPFPVVVSNMPPASEPFSPTSDPRTFSIVQPVYNNSQVLWNGQPVPLSQDASGNYQVQLSPQLAPTGSTGEFALINPRPGGGVQREDFQIGANLSSMAPGPAPPAFTQIPAYSLQVDRSREILYTITGAQATQWTLSSYTLPGGTQLQTTSVDKGGATTAVDFQISSDGAYLYVFDDLLRITRFRTDTLAQDLQFQISADGPLTDATSQFLQGLQTVEGAPESVLVATPAGRLILYDRDQPRPYTTTDFPSSVISVMDPVLTTSSYVYALRRADVNLQVPCIVRYPIDDSGFGPAEDICNLGAHWGDYPEMKVYGGNLVLESAMSAYGVLQQPDPFGSMRISSEYFDATQNLAASVALLTFNFSSRAATYQLIITEKDTGEPIGHYPPRGAVFGYPSSVVFLDDGTMLYLAQSVAGNKAVIVPQWQTAIEKYP